MSLCESGLDDPCHLALVVEDYELPSVDSDEIA